MRGGKGSKMKKILKVITSIAATGALFTNAYAAIEINSNIYNADNNSISVSGKITGAKANIPLGVTITENGNIVFADYVVADSVNSKGEVEYSFLPYIIDVTAESKNYNVNVYSDITMEHTENQFSYISASEKLEILKKLKTPSLVNETITTYGDKINIDSAMYNVISEKDTLDQKIASFDFNLPDSCNTAEDCRAVFKAQARFINRYIELCCNYELAEIKDRNDYTAWADKYYDMLDMGAKFRSYYDEVVNNSGFISRIDALDAGDSIADVKQKIFDCVFLETVQNNTYQKIMGMVPEFPQYINLDAELSGLTAVQISKKYDAVAQKNFSDIPAFKKAFQDAPTGNDNGGGTGGGTGSGSGGSNGTGNVSITNTLPSQTTPQGTKEMNFTDIESVPWALDAISECYKHGVISGRTDEIFAPQDYVTRAEFIKMITTALNKNVNSEITFSDVTINDWFYPYVKAAYALGLIHGNDNNCFMPNENITRQDMALIIYNALQNTSKGDAVEFADKEQISSYAMDAVGYLYQNNLISGMGDNTFAPLNNTTRAEAASIIYRVFLK